MPELPEVDKMVSKLREWTKDYQHIGMSQVLRGDYLPGDISNSCLGDIENIYRVGKFIIFDMKDKHIVCHNAMSGFWDTEDDPWTFDYVEGKRTANDRDVRVKLKLIPLGGGPPGKVRTLRFHDARLFGSLKVVQGKFEQKKFCDEKRLGPDAIKTEYAPPERDTFNTLDLAVAVGGSKKPIKSIIMNQANVAGVGNIYASEALYLAQIHPERPGNTLVGDEVYGLFLSIQHVLKSAIERDLHYGDNLKVYRRKRCVNCMGRSISTVKIDGRSTYFCAGCQK